MPMNKIQFQAGLSMAAFMKRYGTEEKCQAALEVTRWPQGFACPCCHGQRHCTLLRDGRKYFQCYRCRHQTSLVSGTIFQSTKLPLTTWFLAMHLLTQSKNNVSALELKRHLGVSYPTAWLIKHKLMQVMCEREEGRILEGRVELDDAYLGGEKPGKPGRGSTNKIPFVAAIQTSEEGHPLYVRLNRLAGFTKEAIDAWANQALAPTAQVFSDGLACFQALAANTAAHQAIITGSGRQAVEHPQFLRINTLLGNLKTAITGTYHAFKFDKYADRYLAEVQYRFNRRFDLSSILPRLIRAAAVTRPKPEPLIRLAELCC